MQTEESPRGPKEMMAEPPSPVLTAEGTVAKVIDAKQHRGVAALRGQQFVADKIKPLVILDSQFPGGRRHVPRLQPLLQNRLYTGRISDGGFNTYRITTYGFRKRQRHFGNQNPRGK